MVGIPKTLEGALRDRYVVPFVGAGVSMAVRDRSGEPAFPNWAGLLSGAAKRLRDDGKTPEANVVEGLLEKRHPDYFMAAEVAREGMGPGWHRYLREVLDPPRDRIDPGSLALARAVWRLPSKLVVTTNYDQVLRYALEEPNDLMQINVDATAELSAMLRDRIERPTVWHLHGHIHDAQRLILTPDGYRQLYPSQDEEVRYRAALQALRHLLAARTFLFIGFSLDDERFGDQIAWVHEAFRGAAGPHYMLVRSRELRETHRRLKALECIEFLPFEEFGGPLVSMVEELGAALGLERPPAAEAALRVAPIAGAAPPPVVQRVAVPPGAPPAAALRAVRGAVPSAAPTATPAAAPAAVPPAPSAASSLPTVRTAPPPVESPPAATAVQLTAQPSAEGEALDMALVRQSYRLVQQYQRRMFDRLGDLTDALAGMRIAFQRWDPALFARHAKSSSEFFRRKYWAWDFLPAYHMQLVWQSSAKSSRLVVVEVVADTGFKKIEGEEPDPSKFDAVSAARSELWISMVRSPNPNLSWSQVWSSLSGEGDAIYDGNDHVVDAGGSQCTYRYLQVALDDVLETVAFAESVIGPIRRWFSDRGAHAE
ncbi:SIR2 family protein [Sorangium sp. So ce291]|uniref:SIR2 family NAD-dependent protein deacylase n=1 Tax=Sorangium sp. So ce291 TaxID=3133294 RepID=UPI003F63871E